MLGTHGEFHEHCLCHGGQHIRSRGGRSKLSSEEGEDAGSKQACLSCVQVLLPVLLDSHCLYYKDGNTSGHLHWCIRKIFFFKLKRIVKNLWAPHGWEIHTHLVSFPCCLVALKARVIIQLCVCIPMWQDLIILIFREKNDALQLCSASSCLGSIVLKTPFWTQLVLFPVLELLSESHYIDAFAFPEEGGSWLFMNASVFVHWWGCELNFGSLEILI